MNRDLYNASVSVGASLGGGGGGPSNRYGVAGSRGNAAIDIEDVDENDFASDFQVDEHEEEGIAKDRVLQFSNQKASNHNES